MKKKKITPASSTANIDLPFTGLHSCISTNIIGTVKHGDDYSILFRNYYLSQQVKFTGSLKTKKDRINFHYKIDVITKVLLNMKKHVQEQFNESD